MGEKSLWLLTSRTCREDTDSLELLVPLFVRSVRSELAEGQKDEFSTLVTYNYKCKTAVADLAIIRYF